jgi:hypothetical protein
VTIISPGVRRARGYGRYIPVADGASSTKGHTRLLRGCGSGVLFGSLPRELASVRPRHAPAYLSRIDRHPLLGLGLEFHGLGLGGGRHGGIGWWRRG